MSQKVKMQDFEEAFIKMKESIIKAAKDYENNPEKSETYIRKRLNDLWHCGKEVGKLSLTNEIFG